ncbi:electron transfer flavoprotein beta subunit [Desulfitispora alkaliphila]|uniref:electron transfer flavoprotein subunit beta/FixA family protein n=1 Tax=Desulfitispora alkaliphila TaxID=622674 RepID=UPI003D210E75
MNILVCVKYVPDTTEISLDGGTKSVVRDGVTSDINLLDRNAVEAALKLKEEHGGKVTVLTMGVEEAIGAIREGLAMGADEGVLISDPALKGSDSYVTAKVLAKACEKVGEYDLILMGRMTTDGNTGQLPSQLAEMLGLPQVTFINSIEKVEGDKLTVKKAIDGGYMEVAVSMPAVVSVEKAVNEPRYPSIKGTMKANRKKVPTYAIADIGVEGETGFEGSLLEVVDAYEPSKREKGDLLEGDTNEVVDQLVNKLIESKLL